MEALERLSEYPWKLTIAGSVEQDVSTEWESFHNRFAQRVRCAGFLSRPALAREMSKHRVFVFPSLMEGSARVVFEAMALGCFIITTPHAGSIVEHGQHGLLTTPGDADTLSEALGSVFHADHDLEAVGERNAALIRESYRQDQYAQRVLKVYETVSVKH